MEPEEEARIFDAFNVELGQAIRFHRQAKNVATSELAATIGIPAATMRRMELGKWPLNLRILLRVAHVLAISLDELVPFKARQLALQGPATRRSAITKRAGARAGATEAGVGKSVGGPPGRP